MRKIIDLKPLAKHSIFEVIQAIVNIDALATLGEVKICTSTEMNPPFEITYYQIYFNNEIVGRGKNTIDAILNIDWKKVKLGRDKNAKDKD